MAEAAPASVRQQPEPPLQSPPELGPLVSEHPAPKSLTVVAFVAGPIVALTGLLFIAVAFDPSKSDTLIQRMLVVLFGLALLGLAVAVGVLWWRKRKTVLRVYRNGLVQQSGTAQRVILWKDVASSKLVNGGSGAYNVSSLLLRTHDGFKLTLNGQHVQGVTAIAALVARETASLTLQAMRERLAAGEYVDFGAISLSRAGVHRGQQLVPWGQVADGLQYGGRFWLLRHGSARPAFAMGRSVENIGALLTLIRELRQRLPQTRFEVSGFAPGVVRRGVLHLIWIAPIAAAGAALCVNLGRDMVRSLTGAAPVQYGPLIGETFVFLIGLGLFSAGMGMWWRDVALRVGRIRKAKALVQHGHLARVMVLSRVVNRLGVFERYRYHYLTPLGVEATDQIDVLLGGAASYTDGDDHLLALCSPDESQSLLLAASGYPLSRLPLGPDVGSTAAAQASSVD